MTKKAENEEVKITVISNDKEETLEEIQEKIKSSEYLNSITTMSSTMSKLSKSIIIWFYFLSNIFSFFS